MFEMNSCSTQQPNSKEVIHILWSTKCIYIYGHKDKLELFKLSYILSMKCYNLGEEFAVTFRRPNHEHEQKLPY